MRRRCVAGLATALLFGSAVSANAQNVQAEVGQITRVRTYTSFGNGDVILWVQNATATCDGFWFRTTELNGKEIMAQILSSQRAGSPMYFVAYDNQLWTGSGSRFCKLYSVDSVPG